ncbi:hypothetical protein MASR1M31_19360 [Porphyromonadaceae bacterium]
MKYYLLNVLERIRQYDVKIDASAVLSGRQWINYSDTGDREVFMFRHNNELIVSRNGIVSKGRWEILSRDSILIDLGEYSFLLNAVIADEKLLILQLDGKEECAVFIESGLQKQLMLNAKESLNAYIEETYILPKSEPKSPVDPIEYWKPEIPTTTHFATFLIGGIGLIISLLLAIIDDQFEVLLIVFPFLLMFGALLAALLDKDLPPEKRLKVIIHQRVRGISADAFLGWEFLESMVVYAKIPPQLESSTLFGPIDQSKCILYVPKGAKSTYEKADGWNGFKQIVEI